MTRTIKNYEVCASQTGDELLPPNEDYFKEETDDLGLKLTGKGPVLLSQYQKCVKDFLKDTDFTRLSKYRGEICESITHRSLFKEHVTGVESDIDQIPESIFSGFTVGLTLTLDLSTFHLESNPAGLDILGETATEGSKLISDISAGLLPDGIYESLRKIGVQWYDGGVICEIIDNRRNYGKLRRAHLKVKQSELGDISIEKEQDYLLTRYPSLCLEPDLHVTDVARTIAMDAKRWEGDQLMNDQPKLAEYIYTEKYISPMSAPQIESTEKSREKVLEFLKEK